MSARHAQWEWFQKKATQFAAHQFPLTAWQRPHTIRPDGEMAPESHETVNASLSVVHDLFFNWDALPVAPEGGFQDWGNVIDTIERGLDAITQLSQVLRESHYLVTPRHPADAWISLYEQCFYAPLIEAGLVILPTEEENQIYEEDMKSQTKIQPPPLPAAPPVPKQKKQNDHVAKNRMPSRK